jgi:hypothetical protein
MPSPGLTRRPTANPTTSPVNCRWWWPATGQARLLRKTGGKSSGESICQNVKPQAGGWKPAVPAAFREATPKSERDGSVSDNCETSAGPRIATSYARTSAYGTAYDGGFWQADPVLSRLTTSDNVALAQAIAQPMLDTLSQNPDWVEYQNRMQKRAQVRSREVTSSSWGKCRPIISRAPMRGTSRWPAIRYGRMRNGRSRQAGERR